MIELLPALAVLVAVFLILHSRNSQSKTKVGVIVLGDIGRSPRMKEHCLSLAKEGFEVDYIAEKGSEIHPNLVTNKRISIHLMNPYCISLPRVLNLIVKPIFQSVVLFTMCCRHFWACSTILMQNPPTIPVMAVVWLVSRIYNAKMVIDWHNYGYTILQLGLSSDSTLVKIAKKIERIFGRLADDNFCVTNAMSLDLNDSWRIKAYSLHDRPSVLTSLTPRQRHNLFNTLKLKYPVFGCSSRADDDSITALSREEDGKIRRVAGRPALIISSTSWTPDEDFSVLLAALVKYDQEWTADHPDMICAITGNGPQKSYYQGKIAELNMSHVKIVTCWLEPEDYPKLLAASDLGVSLHFSSSGLDLPMKVVDMFAAGIPVCARNFKCLKELVIHGKNGCVFEDSDHLGRQFLQIFKKFGSKENRHLSILKSGVEHFRKLPWHYHWRHVALPVFDDEYVFQDYGSEEEDKVPHGLPDFGIPGSGLPGSGIPRNMI